MTEPLGRAALAIILVLAVLTSTVTGAHAQSAAYSLDDVEGLIASGVAPERILEITRRSCIAFELSEDNTDRLRAAGAEQSLLSALRTVCSPAEQPAGGARTREVPLPVPTTVAPRARRVAEEATLAQRLSAGVFRVIGNETGLGFLIDSTGLVLTHAQLLRFGERTTVQIDAAIHVEAVVVDLDEIRDVAILAIDMSRCVGCHPLRLFTRLDSPPVVLQERLLTVGWGGDSSRHARVGLVREIREMDILTDVGSSSAATGAPLVNMDGEVVAIQLARVIGLPGGERVARSLLVRELEFTLRKARERHGAADFVPPSSELLPVLSRARTSAAAGSGQIDSLPWTHVIFRAAPFSVTVMTPPWLQRRQHEAEQLVEQRRASGRSTPDGRADAIQLWAGWDPTVRARPPAVIVSVTPGELPVPLRDPELLATPSRGNFALMRIYRNGTELVPVERSRFPAVLSADELRAAGRLVSYQGIHVYRAEDFADPSAVYEAHIWETTGEQPVRVTLPGPLIERMQAELSTLR
jgi:S1-C subfamily serine protease